MKKKIMGGVYLVLNPSIEKDVLLVKLKQALEGGVQILQIWNHWPAAFQLLEKQHLIASIGKVASAYQVPLLINEEWELMQHTALDGVHFDKIPENYEEIKSQIRKDFICGITCSNDLQVIHWAEQNRLDYISFCSMFPSGSVNSCEIVRPDTVKKAREITSMPIFLSGGIKQENVAALKAFNFNGVAVISGILNAPSPKESATALHHALNKITI